MNKLSAFFNSKYKQNIYSIILRCERKIERHKDTEKKQIFNETILKHAAQ